MLTYNNGRVLIHRKTKENSMKKINKTKIALCDIHNAKLISLPQNDSGNVERFLLYCKEYVKYNQTTQSWFYWNGKYWQEDAEAEIMNLAQAVMEKYYNIAKAMSDKDKNIKKRVVCHAESSNNYKSLINMLSMAEYMNCVENITCKRHYLNVNNGIPFVIAKI